ncbi:hypothetical protein XENTR_v10000033 [Xenopus tropicalis]|nr:hypothetical protein XENTR_v10000033 [Xenopus tropicalis]
MLLKAFSVSIPTKEIGILLVFAEYMTLIKVLRFFVSDLPLMNPHCSWEMSFGRIIDKRFAIIFVNIFTSWLINAMGLYDKVMVGSLPCLSSTEVYELRLEFKNCF